MSLFTRRGGESRKSDEREREQKRRKKTEAKERKVMSQLMGDKSN